MAFGSARAAFLAATARQDEVADPAPINYEAGLQIVLHAVELLRDPALLEVQAKKALEAQRAISTAVAERLTTDKHKREVEAELADARKAHGASLDKERAAFDKWSADRRKEIEADVAAAKKARQAAEADAKKAADLKAEQDRRLKVLSGAV
jgi:hypothetical protein